MYILSVFSTKTEVTIQVPFFFFPCELVKW